MPPQAQAAVATLLAILPHGNRIELELNQTSLSRGPVRIDPRRRAWEEGEILTLQEKSPNSHSPHPLLLGSQL